MNELYEKILFLLNDIEGMWVELIKHFNNEKTCSSSMSSMFMDAYYDKLRMLKENEILFFQSEISKLEKEDYLKLKLEKYEQFEDDLFSSKARSNKKFVRDFPFFLKNILNEVEEEIIQIKSFILVLNSNLKLSNERIDLYLISDEREVMFLICLHDTNTVVGEIRYLKDATMEWKKNMGDVDYLIYEPYRGNGYVIDALYLMSEFLYNNYMVRELFLGINQDNKSSIRVAEKFGGILFASNSYRFCYNCDLTNILFQEKREISFVNR